MGRSMSITTSASQPASSAGRALLLTASAGCAMTVLDSNVVGVILPSIARDLHAGFAQVEWVVSAYVLCFASMLLPAGVIADRFGRKQVLICGLVLFAVASWACGAAPSAMLLYSARAVQGIGAAFLLAPSLATIGHRFRDPAERAHAWAVWGGIMGLTMVISPLVGGGIETLFGWRWTFYVNVPVCAVLLFAVLRTIEESRESAPRPLDPAGMLGFTSAMFMLTWALITGPIAGWLSMAFLTRFAISILLFAAFIMIERRRRFPMLDLSLFGALPFIGAIAAMFAYAASSQVMTSLLPIFLQNSRGIGTLAAGITMLPFALAMLVLPHVGKRLARWLTTRHILSIGLAIVGSGNLALSHYALGGNHLQVGLAMLLLGSGGGLLNGETQKAIMGTVPMDRAGMASGISTTARFSGILLGFTTLGAILATAIRHVAAGGQVPAAYLDRLVAGDIAGAVATLPAAAAPVARDVAQSTYAAGFSTVFLAAAILAYGAALLVWIAMREPRPVARAGERSPVTS